LRFIAAHEFETEGLARSSNTRPARQPSGLHLGRHRDVLDPSHAPAPALPEAGGLTSRELLAIIRALSPLAIVGADIIVEVAPAYDTAGDRRRRFARRV
jgi:agmatinase